MQYKISIITPVYNRASFVSQAIESVLSQGYQNFEHIVIDGGSTDGTLEVLKKYPHLRVVSEPDEGMYDALNKGLDLAQGEIVGFLNTDDQYPPNIFSNIVSSFNDLALDAVGGEAVFFEENGAGNRIEKMRLTSSNPDGLYRQIIGTGCIINAWFFRRELFLRVGKFRPKYKISGDADFMIRLRLNNFEYKLLDYPVYHYCSHGDSLTMDLNENKLQKILMDNGTLAESFMNEPDVPDEVKELLRQNYLNIGTLLANKYLEKAMFDKVRELSVLLNEYDPQWSENYIRSHPEVLRLVKKAGWLSKAINSFWNRLKR